MATDGERTTAVIPGFVMAMAEAVPNGPVPASASGFAIASTASFLTDAYVAEHPGRCPTAVTFDAVPMGLMPPINDDTDVVTLARFTLHPDSIDMAIAKVVSGAAADALGHHLLHLLENSAQLVVACYNAAGPTTPITWKGFSEPPALPAATTSPTTPGVDVWDVASDDVVAVFSAIFRAVKTYKIQTVTFANCALTFKVSPPPTAEMLEPEWPGWDAAGADHADASRRVGLAFQLGASIAGRMGLPYLAVKKALRDTPGMEPFFHTIEAK